MKKDNFNMGQILTEKIHKTGITQSVRKPNVASVQSKVKSVDSQNLSEVKKGSTPEKNPKGTDCPEVITDEEAQPEKAMNKIQQKPPVKLSGIDLKKESKFDRLYSQLFNEEEDLQVPEEETDVDITTADDVEDEEINFGEEVDLESDEDLADDVEENINAKVESFLQTLKDGLLNLLSSVKAEEEVSETKKDIEQEIDEALPDDIEDDEIEDEAEEDFEDIVNKQNED